MKKETVSALIGAMLLFGSAAVVSAEEDIVILYTNDVHCAVEADEENGVLGYGRKMRCRERRLGRFLTASLL